METKNLVVTLIASVLIGYSGGFLISLRSSDSKYKNKRQRALLLVLSIGLFCAGIAMWISVLVIPKSGEFRVQCAEEGVVETVQTMNVPDSPKPIKYKASETVCKKWQWEVRVEDTNGGYKWEPVIDD